MGDLRLVNAEQTRMVISAQQQREIQQLYSNASAKIATEIERLKLKDNVSSVMRTEYLNMLGRQLEEQMLVISRGTQVIIENGMLKTSEAVVADMVAYNRSLGITLQGLYSHVPTDVVASIVSGQVYDGNWTLSRALWRDVNKHQSDIERIIAQGVAQNQSVYDIAKALEKYVDPAARKDWSWGKVYPGSSRVVDYNAQRLARTMVSHSYQQSFVRTTQKNPFFIGYRWLTANSGHVCPLCIERSEADEYGLGEGVFPKDELPLDHPNGECTFEAVTEMDTDEMIDALVNWAHGEENEELDEYARDLGFPIPEVKASVRQ